LLPSLKLPSILDFSRGMEHHQLSEILKESMAKYREIADDPNKLNNYSRAFTDFQKQLPNSSRNRGIPKEFESGLANPDFLKSLGPPASCQGAYEPCRSKEVTREDIRQLFRKPADQPMTQEPDPFDDSIGNDSLEVIRTAELMVSPEFKPRFRKPEDFQQDQSYKDFPRPNQMFQQNPGPVSSRLSKMSEFLFSRPRGSGEAKKPPAPQLPEPPVPRYDQGASTSRPMREQRSALFGNRGKNVQRNQENEEAAEPEPAQKYPDFVSSRDVLKLQNFKVSFFLRFLDF
jgi:hypothetical protein